MKILWMCPVCLTSGKDRDGYVDVGYEFVEVREDGIYEIECIDGHKTINLVTLQKFQILFEIGSHAVVDGYYREAVSSFTSCLERFYEFYIKVMCLKHGINSPDFEASWKPIKNQSERQLGAFIFLYLLENKHAPVLLSNKMIEFRNAVVHKGNIPKREQAVEYGEYILNNIRSMIREINSANPELLKLADFHHTSDLVSPRAGLKEKIRALNPPTAMPLQESEKDISTLNQHFSLIELLKAAPTLPINQPRRLDVSEEEPTS